MGTLAITNETSDQTYLRDFYRPLDAGDTFTRENVSFADYQAMKQLHDGVLAGDLSVTFTPSAAELAAGVGSAPGSTEVGDLVIGATTDKNSLLGAIVHTFTALVTGTADDVTIYAVNTFPFKVQVLLGFMRVSTAVALSTIQARTAAAGGGTLVGTFDTSETGLSPAGDPNAPVTITPGSSVGLFLRRSDRAVAGTVVLFYRRVA